MPMLTITKLLSDVVELDPLQLWKMPNGRQPLAGSRHLIWGGFRLIEQPLPVRADVRSEPIRIAVRSADWVSANHPKAAIELTFF